MDPLAPTRCMHLDMDTFFVSVERLMDASLVGRPVIVGGTPFQRGVVAGCSREARAFGVHSAMPLRRAWELCPQAVFLHPHFTHYAEYSERVSELLADFVPVLEKASIDEFYLDLSGCGRIVGDEEGWTRRLKRTLTGELRLPLTYGVAANKITAKVATTVGKRAGDVRVPAGGEASFLAPHAVRLLPGVGGVMERDLLGMGIPRIGGIAVLPLQLFTNMYGRNGRSLHEHARGIDTTPIVPYRRQKSLGAEHTFDEDVLDPQTVVATLRRLTQRVGHDLRERGFLARAVTVKLRYADFVTVTRALHCEATAADHTLYALAERAFRTLYTRRVRVRLIGVSTSDLLEDYGQLFLFDAQEERYDRLYDGLDDIRRRFGKSALTYGSVLEERQQRGAPHPPPEQ
jgi:DNA polymerase IV